jgi:hypothetical protein
MHSEEEIIKTQPTIRLFLSWRTAGAWAALIVAMHILRIDFLA